VNSSTSHGGDNASQLLTVKDQCNEQKRGHRAILLALICAAATGESNGRGTAMNVTRGGSRRGSIGGRHISVRAYAKYKPTGVADVPSLPNSEKGTTATTDFVGCGLESRSVSEIGGTEQMMEVDVDDMT
jgi:hypothetical protein